MIVRTLEEIEDTDADIKTENWRSKRIILAREKVGFSVHETTHGTTVANLGFGEIAFPAPVFHGDTIRVETEVVASRPSRSRPGQGITTFEHRGYNQADVLVCRAVRHALMLRRPEG